MEAPVEEHPTVTAQRARLTAFLRTLVTEPSAATVQRVPRLVGLVGGIGSGKSSIALDFEKRFGFVRISFADALKLSVYDTLAPLGIQRRRFFGTQADKAEPIPQLGGVTGRQLLELVGTEGYRAAYANIWTDIAMVTPISGLYRVFDDVRFPNEAEAIRARNGVIIKAICVGNPNSVRTGHESDEAWEAIDPDYVLMGRFGELDQLLADARAALFHKAIY